MTIFLRLGFFLGLLSARLAADPLATAAQAAPVTLPHTQQFDFAAAATGRTYRIQVALPEKMDPAKKYPVFYVLDGNWYFAPAAVNLAESSGARELSPAIVVGIGYATDSFGEFATRRLLELSHSTLPDARRPMGDADRFLRFLVDELQPWVHARFPADDTRETLYGKSLGGLAVLRVLFRDPGAFDTYIAASPAIWWNDRDVLADEPAFAARVRAGEIRARLLLTAAGEEQYRGDDPTRRAEADRGRMIDNAAELAARLGALPAGDFSATFALIPDETHVSVSLASLGRALTFALRSAEKP